MWVMVWLWLWLSTELAVANGEETQPQVMWFVEGRLEWLNDKKKSLSHSSLPSINHMTCGWISSLFATASSALNHNHNHTINHINRSNRSNRISSMSRRSLFRGSPMFSARFCTSHDFRHPFPPVFRTHYRFPQYFPHMISASYDPSELLPRH